MPITKRQVDELTADGIIWDSGASAVTGFGVRCQKHAKVFILKYRFEGRARWYTIGKYGSPWTLDEARREARRVLGVVASSVDPASERKRTQEFVTVGDICDRYLEAADAGLVLTRFGRSKKASTLQIDKGRVARHIKPLLGKLRIEKLDPPAIRKFQNDVSTGVTAIDEKTVSRGRAVVTGGLGTATRVLELLSGILNWAIEHGLAQTNPAKGIRKYRSEPRTRFLSDSELNALGEALASSRERPQAVRVITLLALTGARLGEIEGLKWSEVDIDSSCLRLGDTKTGYSLRAVGNAALAQIASEPRVVGRDYIFPATRGTGHYSGTKKAVREIFAAAKIEGASCHTLRHTFASTASSLGHADSTIAALLGHRVRGVTSRYIHRPDAALIAAAENLSQVLLTKLQSQQR